MRPQMGATATPTARKGNCAKGATMTNCLKIEIGPEDLCDRNSLEYLERIYNGRTVLFLEMERLEAPRILLNWYEALVKVAAEAIRLKRAAG